MTSEDFINILIVCSWPPLALMSSLFSVIKEAIVAWSPWGQQCPGSARHFLPFSANLSPFLERLRPPCPSSGPSPRFSHPHPLSFSIPDSVSLSLSSVRVCVCLSLTVSFYPFHPSPNASIEKPVSQFERALKSAKRWRLCSAWKEGGSVFRA